MYTSKSRLSRLPSYLTVHMVRFAWRQDIGKKAKIMVRRCLTALTPPAPTRLVPHLAQSEVPD